MCKSNDQKHEQLQLKNFGKETFRDLQNLGISTIDQLKTRTPTRLYEKLQQLTGMKQDPCV